MSLTTAHPCLDLVDQVVGRDKQPWKGAYQPILSLVATMGEVGVKIRITVQKTADQGSAQVFLSAGCFQQG
jgi:hypothetical protein